jgi:hypothetical protein
MKKMRLFLYAACSALLLTIVAGCYSTGYYGGSATYYHGSSWGYDSYYRSGVNRHAHRSTNVNVNRTNVNRSNVNRARTNRAPASRPARRR